jgi:nucleoside-diphosphate-sugar epimerase
MNVLITGATTSLGRALAAGLREKHQLRLTDFLPLNGESLEFIQSELGHDESTDRLVQGMEAIVHQAYYPRQGDAELAWLDRNTRCQYNLLLAASQAGVERLVFLSTLDLFLPYDEDLTVSENWKPLPSCEPAVLGPHLGEFTAREFAHSHALSVLIVRLGHPVRAEQLKGRRCDPLWVDERDVVEAIDKILTRKPDDETRRYLGRYGILHLQSASPGARFSIHRAQRALDFQPRYNFEENP